MLDPNTVANIIIAGTSVISAGVAVYQASRAGKSAKDARDTEQRINTLTINAQNFEPHIHVPITITNNTTTGAAESNAPLTPVVQRQIEAERQD